MARRSSPSRPTTARATRRGWTSSTTSRAGRQQPAGGRVGTKRRSADRVAVRPAEPGTRGGHHGGDLDEPPASASSATHRAPSTNTASPAGPSGRSARYAAGQALHPPDAAARPGPGCAGRALAGAAAHVPGPARGAREACEPPRSSCSGRPAAARARCCAAWSWTSPSTRLRAADGDAPLSVFLPLNRYRPAARARRCPPHEWLAQEWARAIPATAQRLPSVLAAGRLVLLLDAVNEMPHAGEADYRERVALWSDFLADLARRAPGTRAVFSCRSLDYSAPLSTPEPARAARAHRAPEPTSRSRNS